MSPRKIRRILIHRLGSLGDTIAALPSFHLVRDAFPEARVTLLTNFPFGSKTSTLESIVGGSGLVDDYLEYPLHLRDPRPIWALRREIAGRRFDCLVYLSQPRGEILRSLRDALFFLGCGIVRQVGVPYRRGDLVPRPVPGTDRFQSEAERLVGCLRRLGRPDLRDDRWWDLNLSEGERREADELLGGVRGPAPLLAVSVGTKVDANDWTEANWLSLIRRLSRRLPGHGLVALGSADESDRSRRMLSEWDGPTLDLCGRVRPRVSAAVLRLCTLFIGHNSGPMHLASSVGTPCVAIFSGRDLPGVWFPRGEGHRVLFRPTECRGCGLVVCRDRQKECIVSIGVNEVFRAVVGLLPGDTPSCREGNPSHV